MVERQDAKGAKKTRQEQIGQENADFLASSLAGLASWRLGVQSFQLFSI
jgi:hypothetical protein